METVDLGGNAIVAFYDETVANADIKSRNENYCKQKIDDLLKIGYSKEKAEDFCTPCVQFYLDSIDLI